MPDAPNSTNPLDALWQPSALIAVVLAGEGLSMLLALTPGAGGDRWVYFGLASLASQWIALLTLSSLYWLRNPLRRLRVPHLAWCALGLLLLSAWLVGGAAWLLLRDVWPMAESAWRAFLLRLSGITLVVGLLGLVALQNRWQARQLLLRAKQSELEALQARIRPHFLFNTLNTGAALVHQRPGEAERLLLDLADLFRAALDGPREITLEEELALARRYLEIEALRFGERLRVHWRLPSPIPAVMVPALSIQPLVENAIRHGVERSPGGGEVEIEVAVTANATTVNIRNTLPPAGAAPYSGHKIGLSSSRARIQALTNDRGRLETSMEDGHYTTTVLLPPPEA